MTKQQTSGITEVSEAVEVDPGRFHYTNVIAVSLISGIFVLLWLIAEEFLNKFFWQNDFVVNNRWMFPVLAISFSLIVGICVKYFKAPNNLEGSLLDSMSGGGGKVNWKLLPATVVTSLASLMSGAVVGPEGAIGHFAVDIAGWFNDTFKVPEQHRIKNVYASLASAYNGLIESPIFTAVLANDIQEKKGEKSNLPANLIGGAIGYFIFFIAGSAGFKDYLDTFPVVEFKLIYALYIILFAFIGLALAIYLGVVFSIMQKIFERFKENVILRILVAGVIIGIVGYFFPVIMFSGETQIFNVINDAASYGVVILLVMALAKILLMGLSFKTGYLGGPTFPTIFASTAIALAINLIFPAIPLTLIIAGIVTGALMMIFKTPFMVILLVAVFLAANTNLIALIIIAAAVIMIVSPQVQMAMQKIQSRRK